MLLFKILLLPRTTSLGFFAHSLMGLKVSKNKVDPTGACEFLNNFDLKFLKNLKKCSTFERNEVNGTV